MKLVQHKAEVDPAVIKALAGALLGGGAGFMLGGKKKKLLPTLVGAGIGAVGGATVQQLLERAAYAKEQNSLGNKISPYAAYLAQIAAWTYGPKLWAKFRGKVPNAPATISTGFISPGLASKAPLPVNPGIFAVAKQPDVVKPAEKLARFALPKLSPWLKRLPSVHPIIGFAPDEAYLERIRSGKNYFGNGSQP